MVSFKVRCLGSEIDIRDCPHNPQDSEDCGPSEGLGVICLTDWVNQTEGCSLFKSLRIKPHERRNFPKTTPIIGKILTKYDYFYRCNCQVFKEVRFLWESL